MNQNQTQYINKLWKHKRTDLKVHHFKRQEKKRLPYLQITYTTHCKNKESRVSFHKLNVS